MKTRAFSAFIFFVGVLVTAQAALAQFNIPREIPQILDTLKGIAEQPKPAAPTQAPPAPVAPTQAPAVAGENQPGAPTTQTQPAAAANCRSNAAVSIHLDDIETTKKQAADYTPGARAYYVREFNDRKNVFLEAALSATRRADYLDRFKSNSTWMKCVNDALDELAVIARKTLPSFRPTGYPIRNAAEERVLQSAVDLAGDKVLGGGLSSATWKIETRSNGIPSSRYKHGMLHVRRGSDDSGFCWILYVNVVQAYAGGGTYAGSEGRYVGRTLASCP